MSVIDEFLNYVEGEGITKSDEDAVRSARQELAQLRVAELAAQVEQLTRERDKAIASAVKAEREACAAIANDCKGNYGYTEAATGYDIACREIAATIRARIVNAREAKRKDVAK